MDHALAGLIGWIGLWIESVNDTLKGQLDLEHRGGRTLRSSRAIRTSHPWIDATAATSRS